MKISQKIVKDNELSEISVKIGEVELTVKGKKCPPPPPMGMPAVAMAAPAVSGQVTESAVPAAEKEDVSGNQVKAPIVGTFYSAPSPTEKPFVSVGDTVKKGDVLSLLNQ